MGGQIALRGKCISCGFEFEQMLSNEQMIRYLNRESLAEVFPDLPPKALEIIENETRCDSCMAVRYK